LRLATPPARVEAVRRVLDCTPQEARGYVDELERRRTDHYRKLGSDGRKAETRALILRSIGEAAAVSETGTVGKLLGTLEQMDRDRTPGRPPTRRADAAPDNEMEWSLDDAVSILRDAKESLQ
jgi:hypothetical protein